MRSVFRKHKVWGIAGWRLKEKLKVKERECFFRKESFFREKQPNEVDIALFWILGLLNSLYRVSNQNSLPAHGSKG